MARVLHTYTEVIVEVTVPFRSKHPWNETRQKWVENKLQKYVDEQLEPTLTVLRFSGEEA